MSCQQDPKIERFRQHYNSRSISRLSWNRCSEMELVCPTNLVHDVVFSMTDRTLRSWGDSSTDKQRPIARARNDIAFFS